MHNTVGQLESEKEKLMEQIERFPMLENHNQELIQQIRKKLF